MTTVEHPPTTARLRHPSAVVALGDSIAAGIGAPHVSEGCMALLAGRLGAELVLLAVPGATSGDMLTPGGQVARAVEAIARRPGRDGDPGAMVTLSIGGNDALEARSVGEAKALEVFEHNLGVVLDRLLAALEAAGGQAQRRLGIQTIYRLDDGSAPEVDVATLTPRHSRSGGYNRAIRLAAQARGLPVIDVAGLFRGRAAELTWIRSGDIHPRDCGHDAIAGAWRAAVDPA